jgi:hypothetical protein
MRTIGAIAGVCCVTAASFGAELPGIEVDLVAAMSESLASNSMTVANEPMGFASVSMGELGVRRPEMACVSGQIAPEPSPLAMACFAAGLWFSGRCDRRVISQRVSVGAGRLAAA